MCNAPDGRPARCPSGSELLRGAGLYGKGSTVGGGGGGIIGRIWEEEEGAGRGVQDPLVRRVGPRPSIHPSSPPKKPGVGWVGAPPLPDPPS